MTRNRSGRSWRLGALLATLGATAVAGALAPSVGSAAVLHFGSDLSHPATVAETHGEDSAFWQTSLPGAQITAPADGQIVGIRLRGFAQTSSVNGNVGFTQIHFQDLHPNADGSVSVVVTTQHYNAPSPGTPDTISSFTPVNFCVHRGDYVAFNDSGGFDGFGIHTPAWFPYGVPFQVFAQVPGATTAAFSKDSGTFNGSTFSGSPRPGQELLVQYQLATGPDATWLCPGGLWGMPPSLRAKLAGQAPSGRPAASAPRQRDRVSRKGLVAAAVFCHGPRACTGTAYLVAGTHTLGQSAFRLRAHHTGKVHLVLAASGLALLRAAHGRLSAMLTLSSTAGGPLSTTRRHVTLLGPRA